MKMKWILIALLTTVCPSLSHAQITAATCSESDVSKAWASVTNSTTIFTIPSCPSGSIWTSQLNLTVPSGSTNLTIQGSTTVSANCGAPPTFTSPCTATDNTVIIDQCSSCLGGSGPFIVITTAAASSILRITGLTIEGGNVSGGGEFNGMLHVQGSSQNVRIDHNHFNSASYSPANDSLELGISGWIYGVVDRNVFDSSTAATFGSNNGVHVDMGNYGNDSFGAGDTSWASATNFGSNGFVFIENNTINYGYADDCGDGGRYVFRYNLLTGVIESQTHPTGGGGRVRGCRATEVYGNVYNPGTNQRCSSSATCQAFQRLNSGTLLIWGNSAPSGGYNAGALLQEMRDGLTYGQTAMPNGWGYCGTNFNGVGSNWDQNSPASSGYRCLDQPAAGQGDLLVNDFPNVTNNATGCTSSQSCAWPRQALEPIYEWLDNCCGTSVVSVEGGPPSSAPYFHANVEYYANAHPGSGTDCNGFNGSVGVGCGLLSARPSVCTPKVAYWATDTNTLYQCATANNWTAYYRPYVYPHPLTQGQSSGNLPAAPTNLAATVN